MQQNFGKSSIVSANSQAAAVAAQLEIIRRLCCSFETSVSLTNLPDSKSKWVGETKWSSNLVNLKKMPDANIAPELAEREVTERNGHIKIRPTVTILSHICSSHNMVTCNDLITW